MAWTTSDRAARLPKDWNQRRRAILTRDQHQCQAREHEPDCDGTATEVDHIISGDDHSMSNLQALSAECHKAKTARDNANRLADIRAMRYRAEEDHPGRITR